MSALSEQTREYLRQAGWQEGREIDPKVYVDLLTAEGYPVHESVVRFIRAYAPLRVFFPHPQNPEHQDDLLLDPIEASRLVYMERIAEDYSPRVGKALCLIGMAHAKGMVLCMDAEGGVYGGYDDALFELAESAEAAIEALCQGGEFNEVALEEEE